MSSEYETKITISNQYEGTYKGTSFKNYNISKKKIKYFLNNSIIKFIIILIFIFINKFERSQNSNLDILNVFKENRFLNKKIKNYFKKSQFTNQKIFNFNPDINNVQLMLNNEKKMPHLRELNKKRTFVNRIPLSEKIKCQHHFFSVEELAAFMSFLTDDTTYFETGSGCSSIMAKYYAKKSYTIEGCKIFYEKGIQNGLKNQIILKDLKPDNLSWSYPGKNSTLDDWKNYFQSYKKDYNADVILIDGRFKIATAMDIFNKINNNTIVLIHEYKFRPSYFILEEYYNYIYHWNTLYAFIKKKEIKEIPLEIQKKYWNNFL